MQELLARQDCSENLTSAGQQEAEGFVNLAERRAVVAAVNRYKPPRVIVTYRQRSYVDEAVLPGFDAFTLVSFDANQIETFAHAWYNAQKTLGRVDAVQAEHKAADLARAARVKEP